MSNPLLGEEHLSYRAVFSLPKLGVCGSIGHHTGWHDKSIRADILTHIYTYRGSAGTVPQG